MDFNLYVIVRWWPNILQGLKVTTEVFLISAAISVLLGVIVASLISLRIPLLFEFFCAYVSVFRNSPLLVQLFFLFYALPSLGIRMSPLLTGVIGISLNEGAFIAEIMRGNIQAIPRGDWEAAESLGLSRIQVLRYVILPQAIRDAVPAITGQVSIVLKDTSLLSLIMVVELTRVANRIYTELFDISGIFVAAVIYICFYLIVNTLSGAVEQKIRVRR